MGSCGRLRVLDGRHAETVHELNPGTFSLGRDPGADFHLSDPTVSKKQATLSCTPHGVRLKNRSERNPTHVNDAPLQGTAVLKGGDRILLGTVHLVYEAPASAILAPGSSGHAATMVASEASRSMLERAGRAQAGKAGPLCPRCGARETPEAKFCSHCRSPMDPGDGGPSGTRVLSRPWMVIAFPGGVSRDETLVGDPIRIGRAPDCEMVVDFPTVSGHHAVLEAEGSGYRIRDAGSTNGTFVNGRPITRPHTLQEGDRIRIGDGSGNSVSLTYNSGGVGTKDALGTVVLEL